MVDKIKHSHETGKLSHLELVIMLTQASEELGIDRAHFDGDDHKLFTRAMQIAYDHGKEAHEKQLRLSLRNVLALARRMKKRKVEHAEDHLIRFCAEAGVVPSILRGAEPSPNSPADLYANADRPLPALAEIAMHGPDGTCDCRDWHGCIVAVVEIARGIVDAPSGPQREGSSGVQDHSDLPEPAGLRAREPTSRPVGGATE